MNKLPITLIVCRAELQHAPLAVIPFCASCAVKFDPLAFLSPFGLELARWKFATRHPVEPVLGA